MAGWHNQLDGQIEQAPGVGEELHAAFHGIAKSWTQLSKLIELNV